LGDPSVPPVISVTAIFPHLLSGSPTKIVGPAPYSVAFLYSGISLNLSNNSSKVKISSFSTKPFKNWAARLSQMV